MINTDFSPENEQDEYDGTFSISGNDDTAFFNMNMCSTEEGAQAFMHSKNTPYNTTFGGFQTSNFNRNKDTVVTAPAKTADPSTSCDHNCASCMWSTFCKSATKGLIGLGSGSFIPKLG